MSIQAGAISAAAVGVIATAVEGAASWLEANGFSHDMAVNLASNGAIIVLVSMIIVGTPRLIMLVRRALKQRSVRREFDARARILFIHHLLLGAALVDAMRKTRLDEGQPYWDRSRETLQNFEPVKWQASEVQMHFAYLESAVLLYSSHLGDEFFSIISERLNPARLAADHALHYHDQFFRIDTDAGDLRDYLEQFRLFHCYGWCDVDEKIRRLLGAKRSQVIAAVMADEDCKTIFSDGFGSASDNVRRLWSATIENRRSDKSADELFDYTLALFKAATPAQAALPRPSDASRQTPTGVPVARRSRFVLLPG